LTNVFYGFFSYASADAKLDAPLFEAFSTELTQRVTAQMAGGELRSWRDIEQVRVGERWYPKIIESLKASHILIIMLSPAWLKSNYCREEYTLFQEVEKTLGKGELVVPLLFRDPKDELDYLTKEQRATYDSLIARQYRPIPVRDLLRKESTQRSAQLEELAGDIKQMLAPFRTRSPVALSPIAPVAGPSRPLPPHNLPLKTLGRLFMGRDAFMMELEARLKDDGSAAVTEGVLHGMGGVGKTRLAIEYAWKHAANHSALLFVSAETPELLQTGLASLAATLNLPEKELPQDPPKREAVLRWLAQHSGWLLILDNVDDEKATAAVAELLPQLTAGKTLVTARYDGFPPGVPVLPLGVLQPDPARDFLLARTEGRRRSAADDSARAEELAKELGYLALALEQAGAFIATQRISFERYLAYWRDEHSRVVEAFDKVASGSNHDEGLSAVFATSVARLSANGRRLLDRIAFLAPEPIPEFLLDVAVPSSFETPPTAAPQDEGTGAALESSPRAEEAPLTRAINEEPFDARTALAELYAYSLAAPTEIEGRYAQPAFVVHRLVQDYAREISDEKDKDESRLQALAWLNNGFGGGAADVRNWSRLDPLANHVRWTIELDGGCATREAPEAATKLLNNLAGLFLEQARYTEAEPLFMRALEIVEKRLGANHPIIATRLNNLALLMKFTGRLDEAESLLRRALAIDQNTLQSDDPIVALRLNNLAQILKEKNRLDEAEPLMRRALEINEASLGSTHPAVAGDLNNLAMLLLAKKNRLLEADSFMRRALYIDEKNFGQDHPNVARDLNNLASLLQHTGRSVEAEPLRRSAVKIASVSLGPDHPNTQIVATNYRDLLRELGASEEEAKAKVAAAMRGSDA